MLGKIASESLHRLALGLWFTGTLVSGCAEDLPDQPEVTAPDDGAPLAQRAGGAAGPRVTRARPVVLVGGLLQDANTLAPLERALRADGFDVSVFIPAGLGMGDIEDYARALGSTVAAVRTRTGAPLVDLIGHSEGGLTARRYVQITEGAPVHTLISMGSPQQGTEALDLTGNWLMDPLVKGFQGVSVALQQMTVGSLFLVDMNEQNDPTPGDVRYLAIGTEKDSVTQPVARSAIPGAEHVVMQAACPGREVGHFGLLSDAWVRQVVVATLSGGAAKGNCAARPLGGPL